MNKRLLNTKQAALYLGIATQTLYNWRHKRKGPGYIMVGGRSPRYDMAELERYLEKKFVRLSDGV